MTALANQVTLKINSARLIGHLKFAFTGKGTVLSELMQNARRAGATFVRFDFDPELKRLIVTDDGCGIDDIQTLLTVAESGWDEETLAREHPFGLGFLAAVYGCERLEIFSKFGRVSCRTAEVLAFSAIPVNSRSEPWDGTTTLVLDAVDLTHQTLSSLALAEFQGRVERLAMGFPIPVIANGLEIPRPHAVPGRRHFVSSELGEFSLAGYGDGEDWVQESTSDLAVYLQGLPVYSTPYRRLLDPVNVVHLDPVRFCARLPDRDCLIDEDQAVREIRKELRRLWQQRLTDITATTSPEDFVRGYRALRHWGALELLDDVPYLPASLLFRFGGYPRQSPSMACDYLEALDAPLSRTDVEVRAVRLGRLSSPEEGGDGFLRSMLAWKAGWVLIDDGPGDLHPDHWVHEFVTDLDEASLAIEVLDPRTVQVFDGPWVGEIELRFCRAYRLSLAGWSVECEAEAVYWQDQQALLIPDGETSGRGVRQISAFVDGDDRFCENEADEEQELLRIFILANRTDSALETLLAVLRPLRLGSYPVLCGQRFRLAITGEGEVRVDVD